MNRLKLALVVGFTVLTAACGGSSSAQGDGATSTIPERPATAVDESEQKPPPPSEVSIPDDVEFIGGTSLRNEVAQAVAPWPTEWDRSTVDLSEFLLGIPRSDPRDVIQPIDLPNFEPISEADWLDEREPGALVRLDGEVRFYALSILTRHEIVNDNIGGVPVAVTFCPLCNTAVAYDRRVGDEVLRFGVSGLLRKSDLVMWDFDTTSLWQQITGEGLVGHFSGVRLEPVSTAIVSFGEALEAFPDAQSLSRDQGTGIAYGRNPYSDYSSSERPFLFDGELDPRFPALSRVIGVSADGVDKAYPFSLAQQEGAINDEVGSTPVVVLWGGDTADALDTTEISEGQPVGTGAAYDRRVDGQELTFQAVGDDRFTDEETGSIWTTVGRAIEGPLEGSELEVVTHRNEFWFAWVGFFPDAAVYE
ncbi:MAG: DUF3179 domain-containing protein [Actinomycetia bacterium]|nr:DUF3179 domain-containing protein [Actinomycetes bacterium]